MDAAVLGSRDGLRMELHPAGSVDAAGPTPMWRVVLAGRGLDASLVVGEADWEPQSLSEFFDHIAADWRGWDGERHWRSAEAELRLSVRQDKANTFVVCVELEDGAPPRWRCEAELEVDPGAFQQVAMAVRAAVS